METDLSGRPNYVPRALELFAQYGDREALRHTDRRLSFAELRASVLDLAAALREHGIRPGSTAAVLISLPIEGPALQFALHLLGCRVVWIMLGTPRREVADYLAATAPDVLIYDARSADPDILAVPADHGSIPSLCLGPGGTGPDLLAHRPQETLDPAELVAGEPESAFQTSGTTGRPKPILHRNTTFEQVLTLAEGWMPAGHPRLRQWSVTALWWAAGTVATMITLGSGGMVRFHEDWTPASFLASVRDHRLNYAFMSPAMFYEILDDPALETADTSSLYMLNIGAAPALPQRLREGLARFGPVLRIAYGLSECPYVSAGVLTDEHPERLSSAGMPWGDVRIEIRAEDGTMLDPDQIGDVWVSSRLNFAGYLGLPELTADTLVDGWLRTRDVGYLGEDGHLYLVGRSTDMIITGRGGRKVIGRLVEDVLTTHPRVRGAAVIGVPDSALGEVVHAFVELDGTPAPTEKELRELVAAELPPIYVPRSIDVVDRLPLIGIGKVDKKALRERYATR